MRNKDLREENIYSIKYEMHLSIYLSNYLAIYQILNLRQVLFATYGM